MVNPALFPLFRRYILCMINELIPVDQLRRYRQDGCRPMCLMSRDKMKPFFFFFFSPSRCSPPRPTVIPTDTPTPSAPTASYMKNPIVQRATMQTDWNARQDRARVGKKKLQSNQAATFPTHAFASYAFYTLLNHLNFLIHVKSITIYLIINFHIHSLLTKGEQEGRGRKLCRLPR